MPATPADRRQRLEAHLERRRVAEEARRRGLDAQPDTRRRLGEIQRTAREQSDAVLRDALFSAVRSGVELEEAELRSHYEATRGRYLRPQVELLRVPLASREEAERGLRVEDLSSLGSAERLGPAPLAELDPAVLPEAAQLQRPGQRILVVDEEGQWSVVQLVAVHRDLALPFEAVRERVEGSLRLIRAQEAFRELLADLRAEHPAEIDEAVLRDESLWSARSEASTVAHGPGAR